jgi:hypothetical protein
MTTTHISTKLTAFGAALVLNGMIMGGIAYLFSAQLPQHAPAPATTQTSATASVSAS